MLKKTLIPICLIVLVLSGCVKSKLISKGPELLTHKFVEGKIIEYQIDQTIASTMVIQGTTQDQTINMSFIISNEIEKVYADSVLINVLIKKADGSVNAYEQVQNIPTIAELKGKSVKISLHSNGDFKILESSEGIEDESSDFSLEPFIESTFGFLPDKKVKIGDTWNKESTSDAQTSKSEYTLIGYKIGKDGLNLAIIEEESETSIDKNVKENMMDIHTVLSGKTEAIINCSLIDGFIISSKSHAAMEGTSYITGTPAGDLSIPTYFNIDAKMIRIK